MNKKISKKEAGGPFYRDLYIMIKNVKCCNTERGKKTFCKIKINKQQNKANK